MKISKTPHYSWKAGQLAKGCRMCVKGEKLVLFATGICPKRCYFCPISDKKWAKDDVYANEWKISSEKDIIREAGLCSAKGAGITGGDPLARLERVVKYIKLLKKKFGKKFHIHLYTPLDLVNEKSLKRLHDAGLDEIRFHPDIEDPSKWNRLGLAGKFGWGIGVEIPSIPGKEDESMQLIDFIKGKVKFLNINELEISDSNASNLVKMGFKPKDSMSYAVKGSEALAKKLMKYAASKKINTHYCTAQLKDRVQLRKRILRRAKNAAKPYDKITPDGMLIRGAIYLEKPSFGYMRKIEKKRKALLPKLKKLLKEIKIKNAEIDKRKCRILLPPEKAEKLAEKLKAKNLVPAVVEEYPTWDALEVEIGFL
jgi:pyruvate formate-lyase activating enzyme-like uncharacterized protein